VKKIGRKNVNFNNLFAGIIKCPYCQGPLSIDTNQYRKHKVKVYKYLYCNSNAIGRNCTSRRVRYTPFETAFLHHITEFDIEELFNEKDNSELLKLEEKFNSINTQINNVDTEIESLLSLSSHSSSTDAVKKIFNEKYLEKNPEIVPIFISHLFQSLEISLKHFGIESKLFTKKESRSKLFTDNGHNINKIAKLANNRLGTNNNDYPLIMALTFGLDKNSTPEIINKMIFGKEFKPTRKSYKERKLVYSELNTEEIQIINSLKDWVFAVISVAENLDVSVKIASKWKLSNSKHTNFAIWLDK